MGLKYLVHGWMGGWMGVLLLIFNCLSKKSSGFEYNYVPPTPNNPSLSSLGFLKQLTGLPEESSSHSCWFLLFWPVTRCWVLQSSSSILHSSLSVLFLVTWVWPSVCQGPPDFFFTCDHSQSSRLVYVGYTGLWLDRHVRIDLDKQYLRCFSQKPSQYTVRPVLISSSWRPRNRSWSFPFSHPPQMCDLSLSPFSFASAYVTDLITRCPLLPAG